MIKTLKQWVEEFNSGAYSSNSRDVQVRAGWYDWFCRESALRGKTIKIGNILKDIKSENILNNYRILFKNNCPLSYPLYDNIIFEPLNSDKRKELFFRISIDEKRTGFKYVLYTARKGCESEYKCKNKKELLKAIHQLSDELF